MIVNDMMFRKKAQSPITEKPGRYAGQSLVERRDVLLNDKVLSWVTISAMLIVVAIDHWVAYFAHSYLAAWLMTFIASFYVLYAAYRILSLLPELRALKLGIEGERSVGEQLERLRAQGYEVLHDIIGEDFNIDHLLIGPAGVMTVETKTLGKFKGESSKLTFDGEQIRANGTPLPRNPVPQALAQAKWMQTLINELSAVQVEVWPVVVFPKWFIQHEPGAFDNLWVLEPKALLKFLMKRPPRLQPHEIQIVANTVRRYLHLSDKATSR